MPQFMVEEDIAAGKLRAIRIQMPSNLKPIMPMRAIYRNEAPPGPAGRWLMEQLKKRTRPGKNSR
jgi:DNA-binding transcriptional LysR family regulator